MSNISRCATARLFTLICLKCGADFHDTLHIPHIPAWECRITERTGTGMGRADRQKVRGGQRGRTPDRLVYTCCLTALKTPANRYTNGSNRPEMTKHLCMYDNDWFPRKGNMQMQYKAHPYY